jgi:hypothetical protein
MASRVVLWRCPRAWRALALALSPVLVPACGLRVVGATLDERDEREEREPAGSPGRDAPDSSVVHDGSSDANPAEASSPILTVTRQQPPNLVDLASEGTRDWVHWGRAEQRNEKADGDGIGEYTIAPSSLAREFANNSAIHFAWRGGAPVASEPGTNWYSYLNEAEGIVATLPIDASRTKRTAHLYLGGMASRVRFELSLTDGSAPPPAPIEIEERFGSFLTKLVVVFAAATDGAKLQVKCSLVGRFTEDASLRIAAATLSDGEAE